VEGSPELGRAYRRYRFLGRLSRAWEYNLAGKTVVETTGRPRQHSIKDAGARLRDELNLFGTT